MGWWKVEGGNGVVGDLPLDVLAAALSKVVESYVTAWGRRPNREEWERLLLLSMGADEQEWRMSDDGVPIDVKIVMRTD